MMKKSVFNASISLLLSLALLSGCTPKADDGKKDDIVLQDPVGIAEDYDYVRERNIYSVEVYPSSVNPQVTEYNFSKDQTFESYEGIPGKHVEPKDVLITAHTGEYDDKIEELTDALIDLEENYKLETDALNKDIADAKEAVFKASEPVSKMYEYEPDEAADKGAYDAWAKGFMKPDSVYKRAIQNKERLEEQLKENTELFNLEYEYKSGELERIREKINSANIVSSTSGEVVYCNIFEDGAMVSKDIPVIAVGDTSVKVLKTDFIAKSTMTKALDYYALINGKRYELEYLSMEPEEYNRIVARGEKAYTTFYVVDPDDEVSMGEYAAVVVVNDVRKDVLTLPLDSLKKEDDGYYVYLYDGTDSVYTPVQIGMKDAMFAEVLSGVKLNDRVLSASAVKKTNKTATVTRGDYLTVVEKGGFLFYPFSKWITNPARKGTTYLKEICVSNYEKVTKGQTIAKIEVIPDKIEIDRLTRQINRHQVRLVKLLNKKADLDAAKKKDRSLERKIADNQKETASMLRQLNKLKEYSGIVDIKAPFDGIISDAETVKVGDLLYYGSNIVEMADDSLSYVIISDDDGKLNYGNPATVSYMDAEFKTTTLDTRVVTVNRMYRSAKMSDDWAMISIPEDLAAEVAGVSLGEGGRWERNTFKVNVTTRDIKNVLIVPKPAVTVKDKSTFVRVINDDGTVELRSFVAGGSDYDNYWVIEGLEEGMTVCWE